MSVYSGTVSVYSGTVSVYSGTVYEGYSGTVAVKDIVELWL